MADTMTHSKAEAEPAKAPKVFLRDVLAVMGALSGTPEELVVRLAKNPNDPKTAIVEFSSSGSRDCPLSDMRWAVDGRVTFTDNITGALTIQANLLMAALPDDPSAKIIIDMSKEDRAVIVRHASGMSNLPLMHSKPKVIEGNEKARVKAIPMDMLTQVLDRFPSRFSLASAIKDDALVSDLFVDNTDGTIAGFATNSSAVFTHIPSGEIEGDARLSGQIDIDLIEVMRRLPKGHLPTAVMMTDHSITVSGPRWAITIRRKASNQVAKAADIIAMVKKTVASVRPKHTYTLGVKELEAALKKAATFASGATEVSMTGDGQTVVIASGPEARIRTRINLTAESKRMGFSTVTIHAPSLKQALTAFRDDDTVLVTVTSDGKAMMLLSRMPGHKRGFGNMAMLLAVQSGGK